MHDTDVGLVGQASPLLMLNSADNPNPKSCRPECRFQGKARERKSAREKSKQFKGLLVSLVNSAEAGALAFSRHYDFPGC